MPFTLIIVIGWLYVTVLVAANEPTIISGIISFLFYGALPCAIVLYLGGAKIRRQRQRYRELLANQRLNESDRSDPEANQ